MTLRFTDPAMESLRGIYEFQYSKSPQAAEKLLIQITDQVARLKTMPLMAQIELSLDDLPQKYRSLVILRRYKAIYFVDEDTVVVTDFWDCRRNPIELTQRFKTKK